MRSSRASESVPNLTGKRQLIVLTQRPNPSAESEYEMTYKPLIGFVGLGNMGAPMASNVAKAGFPLVLVDADPNNLDTAARDTGGTAGTRQSLEDCDVIILMLPTSKIVETVLFGTDGEEPLQLKNGSIVVDMSSSDPRSEEHTSELQSRGHLVCRLLLEKKKKEDKHN